MDTQTAPAAAAEKGPSFVSEVEHGAEQAFRAVETGVESVADRIFGDDKVDAAVARVQTVAAPIVAKVESAVGAAYATLTALGAAHVNIGALSLTSELAAVKTSIEDGIITLARHIAGLPSNG